MGFQLFQYDTGKRKTAAELGMFFKQIKQNPVGGEIAFMGDFMKDFQVVAVGIRRV